MPIIIDHPARVIPKQEYFDNRTQEFITVEEQKLEAVYLKLEHSLKSIAAWESKWHEVFLAQEELSNEKLQDYIRCMTINKPQKKEVYESLTMNDLDRIIKYMQDEQSAWVITRKKKKSRKPEKADPAESIYYAMIQYGIPPEYENWHFNRLMALFPWRRQPSEAKPEGDHGPVPGAE